MKYVRFILILDSLVTKYDRRSVNSDGATWYPEACKIFRLKHFMHYLVEMSLIERIMQYLKIGERILMITILVLTTTIIIKTYDLR